MTRLLSALALFVACALCAAPPAPPAPETYNARLRYQIRAFRTERIRLFNEMAVALRAAGFVRDPDEARDAPEDEPANPKATRMTGTIPPKGVPKAVQTRFVRTLLLWPKGTTLPKDAARTRVDIYLDANFLPQTQRMIHRRTAETLEKAGFVEAFGYDTENDSRLVGSLPGGKLDAAFDFTLDLPPGGLDRDSPRQMQPVRVVLARPDWPVPVSRPKTPEVPAGQEKFSPDLRALLAGGGAAKTRLEVILDHTPVEREDDWAEDLRRAGAVVEGRIGPLVTVLGVPKEVAPELAKQAQVIAVRVPRAARRPAVLKADVPPDWSPLRRSGLAQLHTMARRGKGTRVAVIADDFTGWEKLPGVKAGLVRLLDLTAIRDRQLEPDPAGGGAGTRYARSVIDAAPEAEVVLVRIDPAAPYLLQMAARAINGDVARTRLLDDRFRELQADREVLQERRAEFQQARRAFLDDPKEGDADPARRLAFDRLMDAAVAAMRAEKYDEAIKGFDAALKLVPADPGAIAFRAESVFLQMQKEIRRRTQRWFDLEANLRRLRGVRVVASTLVWTDGFPVDGTSALSRYFDDTPFKAALWFQAAGDTRGQSWAGLFRDVDDNGRMEVLDAGKRLPRGTWTREVAWMAWQTADGKKSDTIPAGTPLRLVLQWKEAHAALPLKAGEDPYRAPLANLRLVLVRQFDPEGKGRPADDVEVVAQTIGTPIRLDQSLNAATYEAFVDVKVPAAGRYGLIIEGRVPESTSPPGEATIPATRKKGEVRPRLFIDAPGAAGRPVFVDLPDTTAALGMPADSRRVLAVGAAGADDKARLDSASGSPYGAELRTKPDVLAYGVEGTGQAAAFAAGLTASSANAKGSVTAVVEAVRDRPGQLLRAPAPKKK